MRKARTSTRKSVWRQFWEAELFEKLIILMIVGLTILLIALALGTHADRNHPCSRYRSCLDWDSMDVGDVDVPICRRWRYGGLKTPQACDEWGRQLSEEGTVTQ